MAILEMVMDAVTDVGQTLRDGYGRAPLLHQKSGLASDGVTQYDISAEQFLAERLGIYDPTIGFQGEESGHAGSTERYWLVDPIDGTAHFVRGIPYCTTMVALVEAGAVVLSVIYNFVTGELFVAERNKGARLNNVRLRVSQRPLSDAYLSVETDLKSWRSVGAYINLRERALVMATISCGYEYGLIAQGKIDGRICFDPFGHDWDYGPGSLLVTEAGGMVTNIGSGQYDLSNHNFIAANRQVHSELTGARSDLLKSYTNEQSTG